MELAWLEIKAKILQEKCKPNSFAAFINGFVHLCYDLGPEIDYEPDESRSIVSLAKRLGRDTADVIYDLMLETSNSPRVLMATTNYINGNLNDLAKLLKSPAALLSLSDSGAHVQSICDGSLNVFMLTHWARDRKRGARLPVEHVVRMMTLDGAKAVGLHDRGVLKAGFKADINVIDFDALKLHAPEFVADLPSGATRLMQPVSGFRATIVDGVITREYDKATGQLPGRLLRRRSAAAG